MLDQIDRNILAIIQEQAKHSNAELARKIGMAPSAVLERIRKLEEKGIITGYQAKFNPHAMGYGLLAYIFVKSQDGCWSEETSAKLSAIPQVLECHGIAGEDCYLVKIRARDTEDLNRILKIYFQPIQSIISTRTTIVLETHKETLSLPIDEVDHANQV